MRKTFKCTDLTVDQQAGSSVCSLRTAGIRASDVLGGTFLREKPECLRAVAVALEEQLLHLTRPQESCQRFKKSGEVCVQPRQVAAPLDTALPVLYTFNTNVSARRLNSRTLLIA